MLECGPSLSTMGILEMKQTHWLCFALISLLTGCASVYAPPESGPTATLGVTGNHVLSNQNNLFIYADPIECKSSQFLAKTKDRLQGNAVKIPANQFTTITVVHATLGYEQTQFTFTFVPKPNQHYEVLVYDDRENAGNKMASKLYLNRLLPGKSEPDNREPVPYHERPMKRKGFSGLDTYCTDIEYQAKLKHNANSN